MSYNSDIIKNTSMSNESEHHKFKTRATLPVRNTAVRLQPQGSLTWDKFRQCLFISDGLEWLPVITINSRGNSTYYAKCLKDKDQNTSVCVDDDEYTDTNHIYFKVNNLDIAKFSPYIPEIQGPGLEITGGGLSVDENSSFKKNLNVSQNLDVTQQVTSGALVVSGFPVDLPNDSIDSQELTQLITSPGEYGDNDKTLQVNVDRAGRITSIVELPIFNEIRQMYMQIYRNQRMHAPLLVIPIYGFGLNPSHCGIAWSVVLSTMEPYMTYEATYPPGYDPNTNDDTIYTDVDGGVENFPDEFKGVFTCHIPGVYRFEMSVGTGGTSPRGIWFSKNTQFSLGTKYGHATGGKIYIPIVTGVTDLTFDLVPPNYIRMFSSYTFRLYQGETVQSRYVGDIESPFDYATNVIYGSEGTFFGENFSECVVTRIGDIT